jgi:hypothetical protein
MYFFTVALCLLLVGRGGAASSSNATGCARYDDCKHCAGDWKCVWCETTNECYAGSPLGARQGHACINFKWMQCTMPQLVFYSLFVIALAFCCLLACILLCFRRVCCPRSWGSSVPAWNKKTRAQHEHELALLSTGEGRANPVTGLTASEQRKQLREKYVEQGLHPSF